jgi:hypothetical protein
VPWLGSRVLLDKIAYSYLGACFIVAGLVFYRNYRAAAPGVLRQQLKWLTAGTFVGTVPFAVLYILPYAFDAASKPWMKFSTVSLVFIPLCFGYAIIRYRLMDVDIIFKRGLAYTAATAAIATIYFFFVALIPQIFHAQANGPVGTSSPSLSPLCFSSPSANGFKRVSTVSFTETAWITAAP